MPPNFPRKSCFRIVLLLSLYSLHAGAQEKDTVLLLQQRSAAKTDSARFSISLDLYNASYVLHPLQGKAYAEQMLAIAMRNDALYMKYQSYRTLAHIYTKMRNYKNVFLYTGLAYKAAVEMRNRTLIFDAAMARANAHMDAENFEQGSRHLQIARNIALENGDILQQAMVERAAAVYYAGLNKHVQAVECFRKAIRQATEAGNEKLAANARSLMVNSLTELGKFGEAKDVLSELLEYYKKNNSIYGEARVYSELGRVHVMNGVTEEGIRYYERAGQLYLRHNNTPEYALLLADLCGILMANKEYGPVPRYLRLTDSLLSLADYSPGRAALALRQAQYFSETGATEYADSVFGVASALIGKEENLQYAIDLRQTLVAHYYRQGRNREGDSLMYAAASLIRETKDPEVIERMLHMIRQRNEGLDSHSFRMLRMLYTRGDTGKTKVPVIPGNGPGALPVRFLNSLNPYSLAPDSFNREMTTDYNRMLAEFNNKSRIREVGDSLQVQQKDLALAQEDLKLTRELLRMSQLAIAGAALILVLVSVILVLWIRAGRQEKKLRKQAEQLKKLETEKRKKAEQYGSQISTLHAHGTHSAQNHTAMLNTIVQKLEHEGRITKDGADVLRRKTIALFHMYDSLYIDIAPTGNVNLRLYIDKLCGHMAELYRELAEISVSIEQDLWLEPRKALILGAIITELVTNSCKHAFRDGMGAIRVSIYPAEPEKELILHYRDNGSGMSGMRKGSRGMEQIRDSVQDLNGSSEFYNDEGCHFKLNFPQTLVQIQTE